MIRRSAADVLVTWVEACTYLQIPPPDGFSLLSPKVGLSTEN